MEEQIDEEIEQVPWYKGPIKIMLALILLLIMIMWAIPYYSIKLDPSPGYIPSIPETFPGNVTGNEASINSFQESIQINDIIKQTANSIISKSGCHQSKVCNSKAIFYYVQKNIEYVNDPVSREYFSTSINTLNNPVGDCDDFSILLANLLQSIGIQTRYVIIPNHVYVQALLPEALKKYKAEADWINLDPTCNYCSFGEIPYQNPDKSKTYI